MPPVPNLVQNGGFAATTVPDLVWCIRHIYARVAVAENIAAPVIQYTRRYVEQIHAPHRIVLVERKGPVGDPRDIGNGQIYSMRPLVEAYLWSPEPPYVKADGNGDPLEDAELENELARWDLAKAMVKRFLNVLNRVAVGRIEMLDADADAGNSDPALMNPHGETYLVTFRFVEGVERDARVFAVLPPLDANGQPTPRLSPPQPYAVPGGTLDTLTLTATVKESSS